MLNVWVKHKLLKFHIFPKFLLVHKFHVLLLHYQVLDTKDKSLWQSLSHNQRTCQLQGLHNLPLERPCRQQCSSLIGLGPMLRMTPHGMTTALGFEATLQRLRLNGLRDDDDAMDIDEDNFEEQFAPHTAFMTGKAVCSKINLKNLSEKDLSLFQASMQKEWLSWQKFQAVQELSEEEVKPFLATPRSLGTRWAHTDENSKPRLIAYHMAKKTDKTKEEVDKEYPCEAKSRLVVQGCQEDETNIRSDSPTCSLLAFNLVCTLAALFCWVIAAFDASTANLQSSGINRLLIPRCPRPPPPGVHLMTLFRARGSIHGTKDAGRRWWMKLLRDATDCGWIASKALFFLYDGGVLIGVTAKPG